METIWPLTINNYTDCILKSIKRAMTQHKWKEVLELLPCLLSTLDIQSNSYFVWKIIHCLMVNLHFPLKIQEQLLQIYLQYTDDSQVVYLEWVFGSFHIDRNSVEDMKLELIRKTELKEKGGYQKLSSLQCFAYFKLYDYHQLLLKLKKTEDSYMTKEEGLHIYSQLEESFTSLLEYSPSIQKIKRNQYELSSPKVCEWILGPMLDIKKYMIAIEHIKSSEMEDLTLLNTYIQNAGNHVPALKLCADYIMACYPHRKLTIAQLLQRICILSPSDLMVLSYVKFFRKKSSDALREACKYEETTIDFDTDTELDKSNGLAIVPALNTCQISGLSVTVTMHCITTLLNMLEYPEWQNDLKPWSILTNLLTKLYLSWVSCYRCLCCCRSRKKLGKVLERLALWPIQIWRLRLPKDSTHDQALVTMHRAFSAYFLGYDKLAGRHAMYDLHSQGHLDVRKQLNDLIDPRGEYEGKVRKYLSRNRKNIISKLTLYPDDIQITSEAGDPFRIQIVNDQCSDLEVIIVGEKRKRDATLPSKKKKHATVY